VWAEGSNESEREYWSERLRLVEEIGDGKSDRGEREYSSNPPSEGARPIEWELETCMRASTTVDDGPERYKTVEREIARYQLEWEI